MTKDMIRIPNALRQLYEIPTHPGISIDRWIYANPERQPAKETSMVLPQLSLHTSGGTVIEIMPYGQQAVAQVYGTITATQEILATSVGTATSYPWVRYYARRFGETTIPLKLDSPTITGVGMSVSITPAEFDALDEIIDGWKEITLRFDTAPSMGTSNPQWRWSASGELAGNRWEVLGAMAPAISGVPGNIQQSVPVLDVLGLASYGAPVFGTSINLGWVPQYAPPVSATTDDTTSDAVLMFAQDMPTVSGFGVEELEQEVTGIGLDCGLDPCCIPSSIYYNQVTWDTPPDLAVWDDFSVDVVDGWGTADTGQVWDNASGADSAFQVVDGVAQHEMNTTSRVSTLGVDWTDVDITVKINQDQYATGATMASHVIARFTDTSNYYSGNLLFGTDRSIIARIFTVVAGSTTTLDTATLGFVHDVDQWYNVRFQVFQTNLRFKAWLEGEEEPELWDVTGQASTHPSGDIGARTLLSAGSTNVGAIGGFRDFYATQSFYIGSHIELQRMDTVETEWQTIMLASDLALQVFNDYEARVGIESSYRIRLVDPYDFPGQWSETITGTITDPGVDIGCEDGHLLIFTSNEEQDGSLNLAYSSVWEQRRVEEAFTFPEANFVQLQAMYNRDFFTAFRTTERGGERFQRTVLVQAAAIDPETLADFTSLRDMAWANVSYICVRDEDGNRWFATVLVPGGRVLLDRRLYLAPVDIIEVTATPSQVNP